RRLRRVVAPVERAGGDVERRAAARRPGAAVEPAAIGPRPDRPGRAARRRGASARLADRRRIVALVHLPLAVDASAALALPLAGGRAGVAIAGPDRSAVGCPPALRGDRAVRPDEPRR